jgi:Secretion system C-terminal sorting domain/Beta-propeller repeat
MMTRFAILITFSLLMPQLSYSQSWKWAREIGLANTVTTVKTIRPYTGANVLVSGSFSASSLTLDNPILISAGQDDAFVATANAAGQFNWAARIGGAGRDFAVDAVAAPDGAVYVTGNFNSLSLSIGNTLLLNAGETDAFVVKYNPDKSIAWAKQMGTSDQEVVSGLAIDGSGNVYVAGHVLDKFTLSAKYAFVQKFSPGGNLLWEQKGITEGGYLQTTALAIDENDHVYLACSLFGTIDFSGNSFTSADWYGALLLKFDASGAVLDHFLNGELDKINALQIQNDKVYACGERVNGSFGWGWPLSDSKIYVFTMNTDLDILWQKNAGGTEMAQSLDIAQNLSVDALGNVYVTGYFFSSTLNFANTALANLFNVNYYYPQVFVLKYDASGAEIWGKSLGGMHSEDATCILATGDDTFYLGGHFESTPVAFGTHELENNGQLDSMYVHLRPARYVRKSMGFIGFFDKTVSNTRPEPVTPSLDIWPNPAVDQVSIRLPFPVINPVIELRNSAGQMVQQITFDGQIRDLPLSIGALTPGIYWVEMKSNLGFFAQKLMKL